MEKQLNFPFHPEELRKRRDKLLKELLRKEAPEIRRILEAGRRPGNELLVFINT